MKEKNPLICHKIDKDKPESCPANCSTHSFKIEIRKDCKVCGGPLPNSRFRTYCGEVCRKKFYNVKYKTKMAEWQVIRRNKKASIPNPEKMQCFICGRWYVQVCSHAQQVHGMTGREYREKFDLDVKRGVIPEWYRKLKGDIAMDNKTYKNLEAGAKFRYKKGQKGVGVYKRSGQTQKRLSKNGDNFKKVV